MKIVVDKIISLLSRGVKPWKQPWHSLKFQNLISGHIYTGWNPMICAIDVYLYNYSSPFFVGFNQAKEKGWRIKKGSKSTWIIFCSVKEEDDIENRFYKWFQVFNVDCLDDSDSDEKLADLIRDRQLKPKDGKKKIKTVEEFIESHNPTIRYGGNSACYISSIDEIEMPRFENFSSTEGFYATLLHELTHWTGHKSRLDRNLGSKFASKEYAYEELIAELGAALLCNNFEIENNIENHASYIGGWLTILKENKKALFNAMKEAKLAVEFLLGKEELC
ncbi:MAG: ArdC family protein [Pseudanabaenaceae cyanobacterium]